MDNYTRFPNEILEALIRYKLSGQYLAAMLYIVRNTYGWHKGAGDHISIQKMAADMGTKRTILSGVVNDLAKMGLIEIQRSNGHPSFIRVLSPSKWEQTVAFMNPSPTDSCQLQRTSATGDSYPSATGDRGESATADRYPSATGDTPKKEKEILKKIKESVFSPLKDEDDEWLTVDELVNRRQTNGESDL